MTAPHISVIIATRNREAILWETVNRATVAMAGKSAEIWVVNDGDEALNIPAHLAGLIHCCNNPKRGVSAARNFGAAQASGNILFFVDDDMWLVAEVFDWIAATLTGENAGNVYNINWQYPSQLNDKLHQSKVGRFLLKANYNCMWGRMQLPGEQPAKGIMPCRNIASCSLAMHRDLFFRLGGYKEDFLFQGEDIDLSNRLAEQQVPVYASFDVTLFHNHQDRLEIAGFLERLKQGYRSQFAATAAGLLPANATVYTRQSRLLLNIVAATEKGWLMLYRLTPNKKLFEPVSNRLIGMLAGLQKYKQWKAFR